jgi:hypothetical protein
MRLDSRESARTAPGTQPMRGGPARPKTSFAGEAVATELLESIAGDALGCAAGAGAFISAEARI